MNFYDVYTTVSVNPSTQEALQEICDYVQCPNNIDALKKSLWGRPPRSEHPGLFPFNDVTGRIYDSLWKAAQVENYSVMGRVGRWLMKTICPPADDEGMAAYHRKARHDMPDQDDIYDDREPVVVDSDASDTKRDSADWEVADDKDVVVIRPRQTGSHAETVTKRSKKGD